MPTTEAYNGDKLPSCLDRMLLYGGVLYLQHPAFSNYCVGIGIGFQPKDLVMFTRMVRITFDTLVDY